MDDIVSLFDRPLTHKSIFNIVFFTLNIFRFLLKGHEDLRQDERVMQLFGLTNALLANHRDTSKRNLAIRRYAVIPLSPNCGIIGWVKKKK